MKFWYKTRQSETVQIFMCKSNCNSLVADLRTLGLDLIINSVMLIHICFYSGMNKTCAMAQLTFKHGSTYVLALGDFRKLNKKGKRIIIYRERPLKMSNF